MCPNMYVHVHIQNILLLSFYFIAIQIIAFNSHYCVGINILVLLSVLSLVPSSLRQNLARKSVLEEKKGFLINGCRNSCTIPVNTVKYLPLRTVDRMDTAWRRGMLGTI